MCLWLFACAFFSLRCAPSTTMWNECACDSARLCLCVLDNMSFIFLKAIILLSGVSPHSCLASCVFRLIHLGAGARLAAAFDRRALGGHTWGWLCLETDRPRGSNRCSETGGRGRVSSVPFGPRSVAPHAILCSVCLPLRLQLKALKQAQKDEAKRKEEEKVRPSCASLRSWCVYCVMCVCAESAGSHSASRAVSVRLRGHVYRL